ncbi:MAG: hypothetical protein ACREKH_14055 [Candidatus Rokuibacteriota bacterium]
MIDVAALAASDDAPRGHGGNMERIIRTGLSIVALAAVAVLVAPTAGYSQTPGSERREDRRDDRQGAQDTRQEGRQGARDAKAECKEGDDKTRAECRQDKRDTKQDAREGARDIKQND